MPYTHLHSYFLCARINDFRSQEESEALVFCIREMKALLGVCDSVEGAADLLLLFCGTGSPIKFSTQTATFTLSLIMATLEERHLQTQQERTQRQGIGKDMGRKRARGEESHRQEQEHGEQGDTGGV